MTGQPGGWPTTACLCRSVPCRPTSRGGTSEPHGLSAWARNDRHSFGVCLLFVVSANGAATGWTAVGPLESRVP